MMQLYNFAKKFFWYHQLWQFVKICCNGNYTKKRIITPNFNLFLKLKFLDLFSAVNNADKTRFSTNKIIFKKYFV